MKAICYLKWLVIKNQDGPNSSWKITWTCLYKSWGQDKPIKIRDILKTGIFFCRWPSTNLWMKYNFILHCYQFSKPLATFPTSLLEIMCPNWENDVRESSHGSVIKFITMSKLELPFCSIPSCLTVANHLNWRETMKSETVYLLPHIVCRNVWWYIFRRQHHVIPHKPLFPFIPQQDCICLYNIYFLPQSSSMTFPLYIPYHWV